MNQEMKLAVLIDAENISNKYIDVILSEANNLGNIVYKRIYGNWTTPQMASWKNIILDNAIQPIQQYSNTIRKNSSDSALIIDTMDLLYQSDLDAYCIVSSDSDFTRLASRLRESQKYVLGMGESKTPRSFISACNKFLYLDVLFEEAAEEPVEHETSIPHDREKTSHSSEYRHNGQFRSFLRHPDGRLTCRCRHCSDVCRRYFPLHHGYTDDRVRSHGASRDSSQSRIHRCGSYGLPGSGAHFGRMGCL